MVMARLHLICGNCGCNDDWSYSPVDEITDVPTQEKIREGDVFISCGNCATLHSLNETAKVKVV
jgi:hypothetical protein